MGFAIARTLPVPFLNGRVSNLQFDNIPNKTLNSNFLRNLPSEL
jgi:hypothetical protein